MQYAVQCSAVHGMVEGGISIFLADFGSEGDSLTGSCSAQTPGQGGRAWDAGR